jgi:mitochondrial pyruvate carrier 2
MLPSVVPQIRAKVMEWGIVKNNPKFAALVDSPAGPFTIHFWAPTFKWCITIANIADLARPVEKVSTPQQIAVTATGVIWSRYSFVITPVNYTLFSVNVFMAGSGIAQLSRKFMAANETPKAEPEVKAAN